MSLSSSYQAGGARRHVKQTTVVLTQAANSASEKYMWLLLLTYQGCRVTCSGDVVFDEVLCVEKFEVDVHCSSACALSCSNARACCGVCVDA